MTIKIQAVLGQNITLVYDLLDLQAIDSSKLKGFVSNQAGPVIMDTPEMIAAIYPAEALVIQMGDNRTRITFQQQTQDIGTVPLWEIAFMCNQLVAKSTLEAYGFNYDVGVELVDRNANSVISELFVSDLELVENALNGQLLSTVPRLIFRRDQTRYDLVLEPMAEQRFKVHLNAHFECDGGVLSDQDQLDTSFRKEFEYLVSMLPRLFKGDE